MVEKGAMTSDGIWAIDYVTDTMRRRVSEQLGFSSPGVSQRTTITNNEQLQQLLQQLTTFTLFTTFTTFTLLQLQQLQQLQQQVGEMQNSEGVHSQSEALLRGAVTGTMSSEWEHYSLSFQKDWSTEVASDVLGGGVKTKDSDNELHRKLLRDGGGSSEDVENVENAENEETSTHSNTEQEQKETSAGSAGSAGEEEKEGEGANRNGNAPATKISELLLNMICGSESLKKTKTQSEASEGTDVLDVPDCLLSERNVVLDDDFSRLHAGQIFQDRDPKEKRNSLPGEARTCTAQDIIDGAKILREMGSHIVTGKHFFF